MRIVRALSGGEAFFGILKEDDRIERLEKAPFDEIVKDGREYLLDEVTLLAPTEPTKVVCVGKNYFDHCEELKGELRDDIKLETPILFIKPSNAVIGHGQVIEYPCVSERVDYEAELAIVISKKAKSVLACDADKYILGYTCLNDVTARDIQKREGQWSRAKSMDTFCPIGPYIETEFSPDGKRILARLNDEIKQDSNTSLMMHKCADIIEFITSSMTLFPGDVIATGTPAGIGEMHKGDIVEIEIEGLGVLKNTVG
ncbi:MAG: fumarylacetoacetate hydrolase family protein [Clostridia bacterium]|nr:fumarylacetoacetate hydrolase family protein [Clostridia bacterium]